MYGAGTVLALLALAVLGLAGRWIWGPQTRAANPDYGLLVAVLTTAERSQADVACRRLAAAGLRATVGPAPARTQVSAQGHAVVRPAGHHVLVFPDQVEHARALLDR